MRRGSIVRVVLIGVLVGAVATAIAVLVPWLPDQASEEGRRIDFVLWFTTAICIVIFSVVAAVSIYSFMKFRAPPDDDSDGPPIHGHTGIEIVWTAVPTVIVAAIAIVSSVTLARNSALPDDHMTVEVTARQFAWSFAYPEDGREPPEDRLACSAPGSGCVTSSQLRLPLGRAVELRMQAQDVLHAFWVPEFRQKQDLVPGIVTRLPVTPTKLGTFTLRCAELCGLGHSLMLSRAIVMEEADFDTWLAEQRSAVGGGGGTGGEAVFTAQGCGSCHTLAAAATTGTAGPSLDKLPGAAERAGKQLEEFIRESIVNPNAYVEPGYQPNVMPQTFADLPEEELDALVEFLVEASRKGGA